LKAYRIAERVSRLKPSGIRRMFSLAQRIPGVISMGLGEPDFNPPPHVVDAVKKALDEGKTHYTPNMGILPLRERVAERVRREHGLSYDPESEVFITVGGTQAIFLAAMALINPGDEVLIPDPGFVCYRPAVHLADGVPVPYPLHEENRFRIDVEELASLITERSRMIIVNSPSNPTGAALPRSVLEGVAELAAEHDLIVISDEVYEKIVYDGVRHYCLASFPGMRERTIVVNSFSKTYAMTGLRVGYALGPKELIRPMVRIQQFCAACPNAPAQYGALAALEGPQTFTQQMVREFDRRRRLLHSRINEIEGFHALLPEGAFYLFANIKEFGVPSREFADLLLSRGRVVTVPGSAFGERGEGYLRFSYATSYERIEEALDRIERVVKELRRP